MIDLSLIRHLHRRPVMLYMMLPLDRHFYSGFGAVADSFRDADAPFSWVVTHLLKHFVRDCHNSSVVLVDGYQFATRSKPLGLRHGESQ